jgi:hypothetical protein
MAVRAAVTLHFWEVLGTNLLDSYTVKNVLFVKFFGSLTGTVLGKHLKLWHDHFIPYSFTLIILALNLIFKQTTNKFV